MCSGLLHKSHLKRLVGVAGWETRMVEKLPAKLKGTLPTVEEIEAELSGNAGAGRRPRGDKP